jgi:hypothetical protein
MLPALQLFCRKELVVAADMSKGVSAARTVYQKINHG